MHRRTVFSIAAAALFGSLGHVPAGAQPGGRLLKDIVSDAERAFADSMTRRDLAAFSSYVSAEAVFFGSADGSRVLRGKQAIVEGWRRYFDGPDAPFSWGPENAEVLESGTLAMTTGPVRDESGKMTGRFSSVWRLEPDGHWRVIFDRGCSCA
jgi:ketosteroid isomerase-like protein